jgi:hypothetical protein
MGQQQLRYRKRPNIDILCQTIMGLFKVCSYPLERPHTPEGRRANELAMISDMNTTDSTRKIFCTGYRLITGVTETRAAIRPVRHAEQGSGGVGSSFELQDDAEET